MSRKILIGLTVAVIVVVIFISILLTTKQKSDVINIGLISPFTGEGANYGKAARTAADLALGEINAHGGIKGKKLV